MDASVGVGSGGVSVAATGSAVGACSGAGAPASSFSVIYSPFGSWRTLPVGLSLCNTICYGGQTGVICADPSTTAHSLAAADPEDRSIRLLVVSHTIKPSYLPVVFIAAVTLAMSVAVAEGVNKRPHVVCVNIKQNLFYLAIQPVLPDPLSVTYRVVFAPVSVMARAIYARLAMARHVPGVPAATHTQPGTPPADGAVLKTTSPRFHVPVPVEGLADAEKTPTPPPSLKV